MNRRRVAPAVLVVLLGFVVSAAVVPARGQQPPASGAGSLGDYARNLREKKRAQVKVTAEEAQQIFQAVDVLTEFASQDSGLPQKAKVKRQLVGQAEVERMVREQTLSEEEKQERERGLMALKKFGLLPRVFDPEQFAVEVMGESVAGFYDAKTKTVSLLNWMPLEEQRPVLAHELTHALQDQNYDLQKWRGRQRPAAPGGGGAVVNSESDAGELSTAARAVTEGQAMVVLFDFLLAGFGADLEHSPQLVEPLQERMSYGSEGPALHRAPLVVRQGMAFPYREGLMFEIALLQKGGRAKAFAGAMQRPPRLTREVLHPEAYLKDEKLLPVRIPDLRPVLGEATRVQDAGTIGELDTRVLIHQFESKWLAGSLAPAWRGGSYVTVARSEGKPQTTADVALLYVSRWETPAAAERFAKFYLGGVSKRYQHAAADPGWTPAAGKRGKPLWSAQALTEEGAVVIEQWPGNTVIVTESFDAATAARLRDAVLDAPETRAALAPRSDLTLRLASMPALGRLREAIHREAVGAVAESVRQAMSGAR